LICIAEVDVRILVMIFLIHRSRDDSPYLSILDAARNGKWERPSLQGVTEGLVAIKTLTLKRALLSLETVCWWYLY